MKANDRSSQSSPDPVVLIVDDFAEFRRILRRRLETEHGLKVIEAASAYAALTLLEQLAVDVVVSDLNMPGLDGVGLLAEVGRRWPKTRRLLLTGWSRAELVAGADYRVRDKTIDGWLIAADIADLARQP